jgi:hypothetical protein
MRSVFVTHFIQTASLFAVLKSMPETAYPESASKKLRIDAQGLPAKTAIVA